MLAAASPVVAAEAGWAVLFEPVVVEQEDSAAREPVELVFGLVVDAAQEAFGLRAAVARSFALVCVLHPVAEEYEQLAAGFPSFVPFDPYLRALPSLEQSGRYRKLACAGRLLCHTGQKTFVCDYGLSPPLAGSRVNTPPREFSFPSFSMIITVSGPVAFKI